MLRKVNIFKLTFSSFKKTLVVFHLLLWNTDSLSLKNETFVWPNIFICKSCSNAYAVTVNSMIKIFFKP